MCWTLWGGFPDGPGKATEELGAPEAELQQQELGGWVEVGRPRPLLSQARRGASASSSSTSLNICFFSAWGWGEKGRKQARGDPGRPFRLSTLTRASVIECSFPVTGPAQRGPFTGSPARPPGNQGTAPALGLFTAPQSHSLSNYQAWAGERGGGGAGRGRQEGGPRQEPTTKERGAKESLSLSCCCQHGGGVGGGGCPSPDSGHGAHVGCPHLTEAPET